MASSIKKSPYGYDMAIAVDMRKNGSSTGGTDLVKNAIIGRILDYGLWYADDYGIDLEGLIRYSQTSQYDSIAKLTENELLKDDRIGSVTVTIEGPNSFNNVTVTISGLSSTAVPFDLIGQVSLFNSEDFIFTNN